MIKLTPTGDRRIRIEIQAPIQRKNEWNQVIQDWTAFARPWAARLSHSGRKFFQAQQMHSEVTEVFNIRYLPGITPQMRVVVGPPGAQTVYEIVDVDDREGRHVEIDLVCKAVT